MRLADVMSHAGLAGYAVIAMILFLGAFVAIVVRVAKRSAGAEFEEARRLPLDDDRPKGAA